MWGNYGRSNPLDAVIGGLNQERDAANNMWGALKSAENNAILQNYLTESFYGNPLITALQEEEAMLEQKRLEQEQIEKELASKQPVVQPKTVVPQKRTPPPETPTTKDSKTPLLDFFNGSIYSPAIDTYRQRMAGYNKPWLLSNEKALMTLGLNQQPEKYLDEAYRFYVNNTGNNLTKEQFISMLQGELSPVSQQVPQEQKDGTKVNAVSNAINPDMRVREFNNTQFSPVPPPPPTSNSNAVMSALEPAFGPNPPGVTPQDRKSNIKTTGQKPVTVLPKNTPVPTDTKNKKYEMQDRAFTHPLYDAIKNSSLKDNVKGRLLMSLMNGNPFVQGTNPFAAGVENGMVQMHSANPYNMSLRQFVSESPIVTALTGSGTGNGGGNKNRPPWLPDIKAWNTLVEETKARLASEFPDLAKKNPAGLEMMAINMLIQRFTQTQELSGQAFNTWGSQPDMVNGSVSFGR